MIVASIDPGAERLGYAIIERREDKFKYHTSGINGLSRKIDEPYQVYKLRLIEYWSTEFIELIWSEFIPKGVDAFVSETQPVTSGGNIAAGVQRELGKAAVVTCQALAFSRSWRWNEIPANTVKKKVTGNGHATKIKVRNSVCEIFPELLKYKKDWKPDQWDAIAIGLVGLGYDIGRKTTPSSNLEGSTKKLSNV